MSGSPLIRDATAADAAALLAIYRPFVESTVVSFEIEAPAVEEVAARIEKALAGWAWVVAELNGRCIGYAYGSEHRARAAYRWSAEVSAYVDPAHQRQGVARMLYTELIERLRARGYCQAFAGVTLPNDASIGFHRSAGFETIGVFRSVGRKFGGWHDVAWLQRTLRDAPPCE